MKFLIALTLSLLFSAFTQATLKPQHVAVLYNKNVKASQDLANHYALMRKIPAENLIGIDVVDKDHITREVFETSIQKPLRAIFTNKKWWAIGTDTAGNTAATNLKMKVLVCMRGIPFGIQRQGKANNEASVDSELSALSFLTAPTKGILKNPYFKSTTEVTTAKEALNLLLVGRIDGPSYEQCTRMINDAVAVEAAGLWGMTYLDHAKKGGGYELGDSWLSNIEKTNWKEGIPTVVDKNKQTLPHDYPMSDAAWYFGWYTKDVNGPLMHETFRFRKGAVAAHLHSFSARNLRNAKKGWAGPILEKGAAATVGNVYEPYLQMTHHFDLLHDRLLKGHTFIEAAYMAMPVLSWQGVAIGDPLYRPGKHFAKGDGKVLENDKAYRAMRAAFKTWPVDEKTRVRKLRTAGAKLNDGRFYEAVGLNHLHNNKLVEAHRFFAAAELIYLLSADKLRCNLHRIDMARAANNKRLASALLKKVIKDYAGSPNIAAAQSWLTIIDPPGPAPAKPPKK